MYPRDRRRRGGGTALLAAFAATILATGLVGCGASDSNGERIAERAIPSSIAHGVDSELRSLPVAYVVGIPHLPKPPVPPLFVDGWRILEVPKPLSLPEQVPALPRAATKSLIVAKEDELVAPYIEGLTRDQIRKFVRYACRAHDLYDIAQANDPDDAMKKSITSFGGRVMLPARISELSEDLAQARSSTDQITQLAAFALCEKV